MTTITQAHTTVNVFRNIRLYQDVRAQVNYKGKELVIPAVILDKFEFRGVNHIRVAPRKDLLVEGDGRRVMFDLVVGIDGDFKQSSYLMKDSRQYVHLAMRGL